MSGVGLLYLSVSEWHVWGDNLFCDPNLCVERLQTALQPSHPISQLITVRTIYCVCVCRSCVWLRERVWWKECVIHLIQRRCFERNSVINKFMRSKRKRNILRLCRNKKKKKKMCSLLAFLQTPHALGATSSMRDILSLVSFPIYYSQLCEKHWWRDQQQSLTIYPGATASYSCAKENLNNRGSREWRGCEVDKSWWRRRALIFQGRYGFNAN